MGRRAPHQGRSHRMARVSDRSMGWLLRSSRARPPPEMERLTGPRSVRPTGGSFRPCIPRGEVLSGRGPLVPGRRTARSVAQASANATLRSRNATVTGDRSMSDEDARTRDVAGPPTPSTRDRFHIPTTDDGSPVIYLAGQSLGLQPRAAGAAIATELDAWARLGVDAWFDPVRPWFTLDGSLREAMGPIVGARPAEVALLNSLTVDIHLLLVSFFRPDGRRRRILADGPLFPSDRHALTSHPAARGLDPATDLVVVGPRDGEATVRTEDLEATIAHHADDLALVFLSGVNFATGQAHDIGRLTAAGHAAGAVVGWDLAHAAGNIELALHDWDVDFAAWCTYKYLNGGPGSPGAIFVHERHAADGSLPRLGGWWGLDADARFDPTGPFVPAVGAAGWATSTTSILALAPVAASLV